MAWGKGPADPSLVTPLPAVQRGEHWWPVALAIIAVVGMHVALPAKYRVNPPWVLPVVLLGLLAALVIGDPGRIDRQKPWLRVTTGAVIALLTLATWPPPPASSAPSSPSTRSSPTLPSRCWPPVG
jgi:hypothetical protein